MFSFTGFIGTFDAEEHDKLLKYLGLMKSYLSDQCVQINKISSETTVLIYGVPHGSVGTSSILYLHPADMMRSHNIQFMQITHSFAILF